LLLEAAVWLALARLAVLTIPFPRIAKRLGTFTAPGDGLQHGIPAIAAPDAVTLAKEISWAVTCAARHVPFKAVCLPQALAARQMLTRRGVSSALYFGASKDSVGMFESHAWLLAAGVEVTGFPVAQQFTPMACFV